MAGKLHLISTPSGGRTLGPNPKEYFHTSSDNHDWLEPHHCENCEQLVDYWYDDDDDSVYCEECVVMLEDE
tara:strand:- start:835 stop:1047 length:213 start_codon:yes stop_codon:yes gene_type:complete